VGKHNSGFWPETKKRIKMSNNELLKTDLPIVLPISKTIREGKDQKTIFVKHKANVKPGQFYMLWIPDVDAKPYAVAYYNKNKLGFTSMAIGPFSKAFDKLKKGDKIGLFGHYGNSFSIKKKCLRCCRWYSDFISKHSN